MQGFGIHRTGSVFQPSGLNRFRKLAGIASQIDNASNHHQFRIAEGTPGNPLDIGLQIACAKTAKLLA
jgi:hypothetical protein